MTDAEIAELLTQEFLHYDHMVWLLRTRRVECSTDLVSGKRTISLVHPAEKPISLVISTNLDINPYAASVVAKRIADMVKSAMEPCPTTREDGR